MSIDSADWSFTPPGPNQLPLVAGSNSIAANSAIWLISPPAGQRIVIFRIVTNYISEAGGAIYVVGHAPTLPVANPAVATDLFISGNQGFAEYDFVAAVLPSGEGIYLWNATAAALLAWHTLVYSLV